MDQIEGLGFKTLDHTESHLSDEMIEMFNENLCRLSGSRAKAFGVLGGSYHVWINPEARIVYFQNTEVSRKRRRESSPVSEHTFAFKYFRREPEASVERLSRSISMPESKQQSVVLPQRASSYSIFEKSGRLRATPVFQYYENDRPNARGLPAVIVDNMESIMEDVRQATFVLMISEKRNMIETRDIGALTVYLEWKRDRNHGEYIVWKSDQNGWEHTVRVLGTSDLNVRLLYITQKESESTAKKHLGLHINAEFEIKNVYFTEGDDKSMGEMTEQNMDVIGRELFSKEGTWFLMYKQILFILYFKIGLQEMARENLIRVHPIAFEKFPWNSLRQFLMTDDVSRRRVEYLGDNMEVNDGIDHGGITRTYWSEISKHIFREDAGNVTSETIQRFVGVGLSEHRMPYFRKPEGIVIKRNNLVELTRILSAMYDAAIQRNMPVSRMINDAFFHIVGIIQRFQWLFKGYIPGTNDEYMWTNPEYAKLGYMLKANRDLFLHVAINMPDETFSRIGHFLVNDMEEKKWTGADTLVHEFRDRGFKSTEQRAEGFDERKQAVLNIIHYYELDDEESVATGIAGAAGGMSNEQMESIEIYRKGMKVLYDGLAKYIEFGFFFLRCMKQRAWDGQPTPTYLNSPTDRDNHIFARASAMLFASGDIHYVEFSALLQGNRLDRNKISQSIRYTRGHEDGETARIVEEKVGYLKAYILDARQSTEEWLERFLFCVTGSRSLLDDIVIRIESHGGETCQARTCFYTLVVPNHHRTMYRLEDGELERHPELDPSRISNYERFIRNLEITMADHGFSMA